jgi:hypothetical protein
MPEIWISSTHTIIGTLRTEPSEGPFVVNCFQDELKDCQVTIDSSGEKITSKARIEVSDELFKALDKDKLITELPQEREAEMSKNRRLLVLVSRRVLRLIQQEIQDPELLPANELSTRPEGNQWSIDGANWRQIQGLRINVAISSRVVGKLTERWRLIIQELLDQGEEPLLAMQHLYEAERSDGLRFKWIEATIAAELAIKEILVRIEPKLNVLLIELPSPPLRKLYGEVLESVAGEKSPFRKELHEVAERRNRLVHRPEAEELDTQQVIDYLDTVSKAIRHLLELHRRLRTGTTSTT